MAEQDATESVEVAGGSSTGAAEGEAAPIILDPKKSERRYWTDPVLRLEREVWRPGDGDGEKAADYYYKPGPAAPLEKRWRFYQSDTGLGPIIPNINEPPKYVILDDRAAYELVASRMPRQYLKQYWEHDFAGAGTIRSRRPHRGRGAIGDTNATGNDQYHFTKIGSKGEKYYFTGEKDYTPIIYRVPDPAMADFRPAKRGLPSPPPKPALPPNRHGHNQFTPKDEMVKYGAPHKGVSWMRYRPRVNSFLPRDKSPPRSQKVGMSVLHASDPVEKMSLPSAAAQGEGAGYEEGREESLFVESERPAKRVKTTASNAMFEMDNDDDDEEITFGKKLEGVRDQAEASPTIASPVETADIVTSRRKKLVEQPDFLAEILAAQEAGTMQAAVADPLAPLTTNSGDEAYILDLKAELAAAKKTIQKQQHRTTKLEKIYEEAQKEILDQEAEIEGLKRELFGSVEDSTSE